MAEKKIYIGNGVKKKDNWLKASICLSDIPKELIVTSEKNKKKYLRVDINIWDERNHFDKDVSITVDTWKPESESKPKDESEDLPF